ncbi:MAG: SPOR domain-containing protein [Bacteroidales bacterium]
MRILTYTLTGLLLLTASCSTLNKSFSGRRAGGAGNTPQGTSINRTLMPSTPIKEVEEKLVADNDRGPDTHSYFVIIGSFRNSNNAREYQSQIKKSGFASEILKNEAGLYRVSVMATDDIAAARAEVRRIWAAFPKYSDTWMLIRIK